MWRQLQKTRHYHLHLLLPRPPQLVVVGHRRSSEFVRQKYYATEIWSVYSWHVMTVNSQPGNQSELIDYRHVSVCDLVGHD
jgi:hypothetical protein